jgi:hypothetical protein
MSGTSEQTITPPNEDQQEFQNLPLLLSQWKKIQEEKRNLLQQKKVLGNQIREHDKRCAAMETMIMGTMKKNSIGAIDLKSSAARAVLKKRATRAPAGKKDKMKHLTEYLKSEDEAKKLLGFLKDKQVKVVKESLFYEKNQEAQ